MAARLREAPAHAPPPPPGPFPRQEASPERQACCCVALQELPPVHPGEILREDFLAEMGVSAYRLAKATGMPIQRVSAIIKEKRSITADTALRLGRFFGVEPQWWMNMQAHYELEVARRELGERLDSEVTPMPQAS
ncbi:MAG: HigA family addiction module antidote protein [Deltaproteobacteria bacterium]|nr:HigA family addiction module antidote protein [Deltaproteobacteria bacterium]